MNINAYNIKLRKSYSSSENSSNELKKSTQNIYYPPYDDVNVSDITLPHTTTRLLFTNDRILSNSFIISSDNSKLPLSNDMIDKITLSSMIPLWSKIHKPTPKKIKN